MNDHLCCVCQSMMRPTGLAEWSLRCPRCGTWSSNLPVTINSSDVMDEALRETALAALREQNNRRVVDRIMTCGAAPGQRLLDVGCAHGWFVLAAKEAGLDAEGIEPDEQVADMAAANGVRARVGLFPDVLAAQEQYDVIAFNDVLEHLPDVRAAVEACHDHLRPGGLLSVNIPNSRGAVYRAAAAAKRRGLAGGLFDRLWQVGLPSPHLWYFDAPGLTRLCEQFGFEAVSADSLASITRSGLWQRAHFDRRPSVSTVAGVAGAALASPLLNSRRFSDIMHLVFRAT